MRTFEGVWVDIDTGAPTIKDIAVMQGRMCRYNGACQFYWPVLLHSLAVSDLVREDLKLDALLHDAAEVITSDIPRTVKTKENQEIEEKILRRIYASLNYRWPSKEEWNEVMKADNRILGAECRLFGPKNILQSFNWDWLKNEDKEAEDAIRKYLTCSYSNIMAPGGKMVRLYIKEVNFYLNQYHSKKELVAVGG